MYECRDALLADFNFWLDPGLDRAECVARTFVVTWLASQPRLAQNAHPTRVLSHKYRARPGPSARYGS